MPTPSIQTPLHHRVLALAGLARIAFMVNELARFGRCNERNFSEIIENLFSHSEQQNMLLQQRQSMLSMLKKQLCGEYQDHAKTMMHYMMGLTALEKNLVKHSAMLQTIAQRIGKIDKNQDFFGKTLHENTVAAIAGLYGETLSTLKPRIIVHGKTEYLNHASNTNKVRALLMVGVRMAYYWRSNGGNNLRFIFERNKMLRMIKTMQQEGVR